MLRIYFVTRFVIRTYVYVILIHHTYIWTNIAISRHNDAINYIQIDITVTETATTSITINQPNRCKTRFFYSRSHHPSEQFCRQFTI